MIYLLFMQASHLNWPLTSRPVAMLHACLSCRATNARIFHSSSLNGSAASPFILKSTQFMHIDMHLRAWKLYTLSISADVFAPFL